MLEPTQAQRERSDRGYLGHMLKVANGTIFWNKHCLALFQVLLDHPDAGYGRGHMDASSEA